MLVQVVGLEHSETEEKESFSLEVETFCFPTSNPT